MIQPDDLCWQAGSDNAQIDELEKELAEEQAAFAVPLEERQAIAWRRFKAGEKYLCSTGIHGYITRGYGLLDDNGFWQYPLPDGERVEE